MFLLIFSIEHTKGEGDRGRNLHKNEKNLFVNQFPQRPWHIKRSGGGNNPAEEQGGQGIPRKVGDPLFPPVVAFEVQ